MTANASLHFVRDSVAARPFTAVVQFDQQLAELSIPSAAPQIVRDDRYSFELSIRASSARSLLPRFPASALLASDFRACL